MNEKKTSWGAIADWYDELVEDSDNSFQKKVILPNIERIVDPKKGMTVLDLACGQGFFSRVFHEKGAKVIGCDLSPELIKLAKEKSSRDITYHVSSAADLSFLEDGKADVVVIILALQNIDKLAETIAEASRVLKAGGRFVAVLNHPAFRIPKSSSWDWDDKSNKAYRRIDAYMSDKENKIDMTPGEKDPLKKKFTFSYHRPLQVYFKAMVKEGLAVIRLEEWISHKKSQVGPKSAEEDRIRKEIPMFICLEAKKI